MLELNDVTVVKDGKKIIENIDWSVSDGENWAVFGPNGSGKSFLLRIIYASQNFSTGKVSIFGKEIGKISIWELKKYIGFVSDLLQKDYHERSSVIDVICSGFFSSIGLYDDVSDFMIEKSKEIMASLGIRHLSERRYGELSHGEQRRVLIARALVFDPRLLILDEPCTGLDIQSRERFLSTVENISKQRNIIFVTHHIEEIMPCITHVIFMKDGKVYGIGTKDKMMTEKNIRDILGYDGRLIEEHGRYYLYPKTKS
jgi:iron complex transport system ATP-binding protein